MVLGSGVGVGRQEERRQAVTNPNGQPTLPPRHAEGNPTAGNHESASGESVSMRMLLEANFQAKELDELDVEAVCYPKCEIADRSPLSLLHRYRQQVSVGPEGSRPAVRLTELDSVDASLDNVRHDIPSSA